MLYHNNGDGTFTDVSAKAGIADPGGKGLGVSFADYDGDGFTDVYVANDSVQCFLYHNNRDGTFTEVGLLLGVGFNEDGKTFAGMGVDFADYDNDGRPDIVVTDLSNERYRLFHQGGDGSFQDVTHTSGVGAATLLFSGWSTRLFDYDNDGWKDLFVAQGHVMDTIEKTSPNLRYQQPPLLLRNESGRFVEGRGRGGVHPGLAGRGAAFGDLDNDGDIDVVVSNVGERALVLRNDGGNLRNWLGIRTVGRTSNRDGIGCRVKVVSALGATQYATVTTAVGYLSASDQRLLVGLGDARPRRAGRDPLAFRRRAEAPRRGGRADHRGERARSMMTRRGLLALLATSATRAFGQGISSRGVKPQPRGKPSGLPFRSRLTDVAAQAGLTQPIVYGGIDTKSYIVEVVGCGVAFFDYDNDGWLDILVLNGTRLEGRAAGHHEPALQEQPRRHVHRRHGEGRA